jgi:chorismate mutase
LLFLFLLSRISFAPFVQISLLSSAELAVRHGALLSLAAAISSSTNIVCEDHVNTILQSLADMNPSYLTSFGSELTLSGVLMLLASVAQVSKTLTSEIIQTRFVPFVEGALIRNEKHLQEEGSCLAAEIFKLIDPSNGLYLELLQKWADHVTPTLLNTVHHRRGFSRALGNIKYPANLSYVTDIVLPALIRAAQKQTIKGLVDAESRQHAIEALGRIFILKGYHNLHNAELLVPILLDSLNDYTKTAHGDVGSWVRMQGIESLARLVQCSPELVPSMYENIISNCLHQCMSKIDRVRECAGSQLILILNHINQLPNVRVAQFPMLMQYVVHSSIEWVQVSSTFASLAPLLDSEMYMYPIALGFLLCMGALTESVVRHAGQVFMNYLEGKTIIPDASCIISPPERVQNIAHCILKACQENPTNDRIITPIMESLDVLYSNQILYSLEKSFHIQIIELIQKELIACKNINKILCGHKVYAFNAII